MFLFLFQPIFAMSEAMAKFAEQFVEMEAQNNQLRKSAAEAEKMAEEAWQQIEDLKKELKDVKADLKKEVEVRETLKKEVDKRDARLRKSIESLLGMLLLTSPSHCLFRLTSYC